MRDKEAENSLYIRLGLRCHDGANPAVTPDRLYKGYISSTIAVTFGLCFIYAAFVSKVIPSYGNPVLEFIKRDTYYCYLLPLTILPTYLIIYLNWLSMRLFEHS